MRDDNLIWKMLKMLSSEPRGWSFGDEEAKILGCTREEMEYNLEQADQSGLIVIGSRPLQGDWAVLRLTPKGHDFLKQRPDILTLKPSISGG